MLGFWLERGRHDAVGGAEIVRMSAKGRERLPEPPSSVGFHYYNLAGRSRFDMLSGAPKLCGMESSFTSFTLLRVVRAPKSWSQVMGS
jgi:hypothetical protein